MGMNTNRILVSHGLPNEAQPMISRCRVIVFAHKLGLTNWSVSWR